MEQELKEKAKTLTVEELKTELSKLGLKLKGSITKAKLVEEYCARNIVFE